jgi:class 3 adenylate cyclase
MRRRLVTLFADIAGSTRIVMRHEPEKVLESFQCFSELVSDIALERRGHVKDFEGDGVLLYFDSAVDAAEAALAIRAALDRGQCDSECGGGPGVPARLALTVGDVAIGVVGPPLHRAVALVGPSIHFGARLLKAVPPGGIGASAELVAALEVEAPSLARRFRLFDPAYEVPGAAGLSIAVYTLADDRRSDDLATVGRPPQLRAVSASALV